MAKKTTKRTTRSSSSGSSRITLNKFAFWLIIFIGFAMTIGAVCNYIGFKYSAAIFNWIKQICFTLAMFVPLILSYRHARLKSQSWFIAWIIFAVLIAFGLVSALISLVL
ncbi:MAG: hypothetical protein K2M47_06500 [Clostridiales bacterium]|nr:hypothetical protein [Clostridiales bacterium]